MAVSIEKGYEMNTDAKHLYDLTLQVGRGEATTEHLARRARAISEEYEENRQLRKFARAMGFRADTTLDQMVTGILKRVEICRRGYKYMRENPPR